MWKKTTDTAQIGNYVYGLAIPVHGTTYIVKYVGQACANNINRCFQHQEEAGRYLQGQGTSNVRKVEMINYYASNGNFEIIILAHQIPLNLLDTMENIYRQLADFGALLFNVYQGDIIFEHNLTNIAYTHNNKLTVQSMVVKPMSVKQIEDLYSNKVYLQSSQVSTILGTQQRILYILNRPGIHPDGYIGWWRLNASNINAVDWVICVGNSGKIEHVFKRADITFCINPDGKKGFFAKELTNHLDLLKAAVNGDPCFDVNGKGWNRYGKAFEYL